MPCESGLNCALEKVLKVQTAILPVKIFLHVWVEKQSRRGERQSTASCPVCGVCSSTPVLLEQAAKEDWEQCSSSQILCITLGDGK